MSDELPTAAPAFERIRLFPPELEIGPEEGFTPGKDIFDRKPFGERLTNIVKNIENPAVLLLDGQWGVGKTTFIRMWMGQLTRSKIPHIYFDAFANDYHEDAFLTIAGELVTRVEELRPKYVQSIESFKLNAVKVAKALGRASLKIGVRAASAGLLTDADVAEAIRISSDSSKIIGDESAKALDDLIKERLESHRADRSAFDQFKTALTEVADALTDETEAPGPRPPLVFIIDELDRCRPTFALDLLEKIKHFFAIPGVVFLLATSLRQLESAVRFAYGEIEARTYLEKFYHLRILFPTDLRQPPGQSASARYLAYLSPGLKTGEYKEIIEHFCRVQPLSLRTLERVATYTKIASISIPENHLIVPGIIAILCIAKVTDPHLYNLIRSGRVAFEQVDAVFCFRDWRDEHEPDQQDRVGMVTEMWWRYVLGAPINNQQEEHIRHFLFQYSVRRPKQISLNYCEVIDGFSFP
jgi:hypothetical protein